MPTGRLSILSISMKAGAKIGISWSQADLGGLPSYLDWKFAGVFTHGFHSGTSGQDDLLFYTRTGGGSFFQINTDGSVHLIKTNTGWAKTWSHIVRLKPSSIKYVTQRHYFPELTWGLFILGA